MNALIVSGLSKTFGDSIALRDAGLELEPGKIHALVGENGAGKSTLVKVLSGIVVPDSGQVRIGDELLSLGSPAASRAVGIHTAFQELSLLPNLTVAHNLLIAKLPSRLGVVRPREIVTRARTILERWGISDIDPAAPVGTLPLSSKQRIEIVRAFEGKPRILILDEPTASLPDTQWIFKYVRQLRDEGTSVLYISHKLAEIAALCDQGTIMRNGQVVDSFDARSFDYDAVISTMIGRSIEQAFPPKAKAQATADAALTVNSLHVEPTLQGVSFTLNFGEILGVAALEGQGQRELFYTLAGAQPHTSGEVRIGNTPLTARSPRAALRTGPGIALVPEERKSEGIFADLDAITNISVPKLKNVSRWGYLRGRTETKLAREAGHRNHLPDAFLHRTVGRLSGGNQQKTILARVGLSGARVLLMFDPTRGIDAGAKLEVYRTLRQAADNGAAILLYSTEIPELLGLADRTLVLYHGQLVAEFGSDADEAHVMAAAVGRQRPVTTTGAHP